MIRDLCIQEDLVCIHAITPKGGGGKSILNNENIDIYDRFDFNIKQRKGIATSIIRNIRVTQKKFGTQGLIIFDGSINNVNCTDAGSCFNDELGIWETTEGINNPNLNQTITEINNSTRYPELNIFDYKICGFFLDLTDVKLCRACIRTLKEFYDRTRIHELPYYGLTDNEFILINETYMENDDWLRIASGRLVNFSDIYSEEGKVI